MVGAATTHSTTRLEVHDSRVATVQPSHVPARALARSHMRLRHSPLLPEFCLSITNSPKTMHFIEPAFALGVCPQIPLFFQASMFVCWNRGGKAFLRPLVSRGRISHSHHNVTEFVLSADENEPQEKDFIVRPSDGFLRGGSGNSSGSVRPFSVTSLRAFWGPAHWKGLDGTLRFPFAKRQTRPRHLEARDLRGFPLVSNHRVLGTVRYDRRRH